MLRPGLFVLIILLMAGTATFFWLWPGLETHRAVNIEYFSLRLERLAGAGAIDCGRLVVLPRRSGPYMSPSDAELPGQLVSTSGDPFACMQSAAKAGVAFRSTIVSYPWGNHEQIWQGLASNGRGGHWQISLAPDVTGGWGDVPKPRMEARQCKAFVFRTDRPPSYGFCDFGVAPPTD